MTNELVTIAQMTPATERFCATCNEVLTVLEFGQFGRDEDGVTDIAYVCTNAHCPMYDQEQAGKLADE